MNTSINLSPTYVNALLSLSDDMKLRVIKMLSESMLKAPAKAKQVRRAKAKKLSFEQSTMDYIDSISIVGGQPVPDDMNDISSLSNKKSNSL
jgi:hypothetical protein